MLQVRAKKMRNISQFPFHKLCGQEMKSFVSTAVLFQSQPHVEFVLHEFNCDGLTITAVHFFFLIK